MKTSKSLVWKLILVFGLSVIPVGEQAFALQAYAPSCRTVFCSCLGGIYGESFDVEVNIWNGHSAAIIEEVCHEECAGAGGVFYFLSMRECG